MPYYFSFVGCGRKMLLSHITIQQNTVFLKSSLAHPLVQMPVRARKVIRHRQQPGDEIKRAREKRHFLFICHPAS
jgi:hypothetical protein